jgi:hypothetical protein
MYFYYITKNPERENEFGWYGILCAGPRRANGEVAIGLRDMGYLSSSSNLQSVLIKRSEDF